MCTADIYKMIEVLTDNIFVHFGRCLFCYVIGMPMGTNCAPLLQEVFGSSQKIYPSQLTVQKVNKSDQLANYLDFTFIIDSGGINYQPRFLTNVMILNSTFANPLFLSRNNQSGPFYGAYILQSIRYAQFCSHYDDFRYRHQCLVYCFLSQGNPRESSAM